jgi:glucosamine--fructose-6-phosphate aminotransferase (isomerizing)
MCGIVGYVGRQDSLGVLLGGLKRQEYRGYDSAGVAVLTDSGDLVMAKKAGKLQMLVDNLTAHPIAAGHAGIGHTRWATHGAPIDVNAHPHLADGGRLALIHNGIVENFFEIKTELLGRGH